MGSIAVFAFKLPDVLNVTTYVNGEKRQNGNTNDLIFSVPNLIKTLSEAQILRPGDVIATGTPARVGFGLNSPRFLEPGDVVEISVTGLGTLRNKVSIAEPNNHVSARIAEKSYVLTDNAEIILDGLDLVSLANGKQVNVQKSGDGPRLIVFIHGLGGTNPFYAPLLSELGLANVDHSQYTCLTYDLEGHGTTPTKATSIVTISSLANDLYHLMHCPALKLPLHREMTIVAHSMGCLIAETLASQHPEQAQRLILIGPPPTPLPQGGVDASVKRAATVRAEGVRNVAMAVAAATTSENTKTERPLSFTAVQMSLLSQDQRTTRKAVTALASGAKLNVDLSKLQSDVLIIASEEDEVSPKAYAEKLNTTLKHSKLVMLPDVGH